MQKLPDTLRRLPYLFKGKRLQYIIHGLHLKGRLGIFKFIIACEKNDLSGASVRIQLLRQFDTVHNRHMNVRDHNIGLQPQCLIITVSSAPRRINPIKAKLIPGNIISERFQFQSFIINKQQTIHFSPYLRIQAHT